MRPVHAFLLLALVAVLASSCSGFSPSANPATQEAFELAQARPESGWQTTSPEQQGMDADILADMLASIQQQGLNLDSLIVIRNGYIVLEAYFYPDTADTLHEIYSCTKSVIATLVGMAVEDGYIQSLDQPVLDFFPGKTIAILDERKQALTLEDVLTMTAGLDWEESDREFGKLYYSQDWVSYMLGLPMFADPGSQFRYCSGCSHILSAVLQSATGMHILEYARQKLFEPLGIKDYHWETDQSGLPIGGWGLNLTSRDMAKLGYLYLKQGSWDGEQIVSADWIAAAVQKRVDSDGELGYGYQWWVYPSYGAYTSLGRGGQTIFVVPDQELIVVTTAEMNDHGPIFRLIEDFILPAVRSTGPLPANLEGETRLQSLIAAAGKP